MTRIQDDDTLWVSRRAFPHNERWKMITVEFSEVGRDKRKFTASMAELDHSCLYRAVKRAKAIMSKDIEFMADPDSNAGTVVVGGCRIVGFWKVLPERLPQ